MIKMKKGILFLLFIFCFWNCNSEEGLDCFKKQGNVIIQTIEVENFTKITISKGIELFVKQSNEQSVKVKMGENLIGDILFEIIDNELKITDKNGCELLRNYHPAQVFIETPVLEKIYSASQYSIHSEGVLTFPELILESGIQNDTP